MPVINSPQAGIGEKVLGNTPKSIKDMKGTETSNARTISVSISGLLKNAGV